MIPNFWRIGWVCAVLTRNDVVSIAAVISPYCAMHDAVRACVGRFVEVCVDVPLATAIERATKGLERKALSSAIQQFTGVNNPYEAPLSPAVTIHSADESSAQGAARILVALEQPGYLQPAPRSP